MTMTDPETKRCECNRCRSHDDGHRGPYTPSEFVEHFDIVEPASGYEVSQEVVDAAAVVDDALELYDQADRLWQESTRHAEKLKTQRTPEADVKHAEKMAEAAWQARERNEAHLREARRTYRRIAKVDEYERIRAEIVATTEARDTARAVDDEVDKQQSEAWHRRLRGSKG